MWAGKGRLATDTSVRCGSGIGLDVCSSTAPNEWGGLGGGQGSARQRRGSTRQDREEKPGEVQGVVGPGVEYCVPQGHPGIELASQQGAETAMPLALAGPHFDAMYHCLEGDPRRLLVYTTVYRFGKAPAGDPPGNWLLTSGHSQGDLFATVAMCARYVHDILGPLPSGPGCLGQRCGWEPEIGGSFCAPISHEPQAIRFSFSLTCCGFRPCIILWGGRGAC